MLRLISGTVFLICIQSIVIEEAKQTINLESHLSKLQYELKFNDVDDHFIFLVESLHAENLVHISAVYKNQELKYIEIEKNQFNDRQFKFHKLPSKGNISVTVKCTFFGLQNPKPYEIEQKEKQNVRFTGNSYLYSLYNVNSQSGTIIMPRTNIIHYQFQDKKFSKASNKIHIGPYEIKPPMAKSEFSVHFETVGIFLTVKKLDRTIELSQWGNIAVEDSIQIYHSGAKLKGPFSRFDFKFGHGTQSVVSHWNTHLPKGSKDIYYRDAIGNVSTSHITKKSTGIDLEIEPRFPLMGGWKTEYILGYNLPTKNYLFQKDNHFALRIKALDHIHVDQFVQELNLEIILPECVENIKIEYPYELERLPDSLKPTYLDTTGRVVIRLKKNNLIDLHIKDIIIHYDFVPMKMLREFFFTFIAFFMVMMTIIIYVRLDFSIHKDEYKEVQKKVQSMVSKLVQIYEKQNDIYEKLEQILKKYRLDKDSDEFNSEWKSKMKQYSENKAEINSIKTKLSPIWPEGTERMNQLISLDSNFMDLIQESNSITEKLINGKLNKSQYQSIESDLGIKKSSIIENIDSCIEKL